MPIVHAIHEILLAAATICLTTLHFFLTSCARVAHHGFSGQDAQLTGGVKNYTCTTARPSQLHAKTAPPRHKFNDTPTRRLSPTTISHPVFYGANNNDNSKTSKSSNTKDTPTASNTDVFSRPEPATAKAALSGPDAALWREALAAEWDMLWQRGTFKPPKHGGASSQQRGCSRPSPRNASSRRGS